MDIIKNIRKIAESTRNKYLNKAKKNGSKIIGYFCSYIPEEIIHAAGFIPYRMRAVESDSTEKGDIYFSPLNCTFVRHCFDKAIRGDFKFLNGVIFMNGCDHTRRMYDNWRDAKKNMGIKPDFLYMFVAPHIVNSDSIEQYTEEISLLISGLENNFNVNISDNKIKKSIKLYNKKKTLLNKIYEKRKREEVPVSGSEALSIMLAVTAMPVEDAIGLLEEIDTITESRVVSSKDDLRILITSGCMEEIAHLEMIEEKGAIIVADNICLGTRYSRNKIDEAGNPIKSIARGYLANMFCPRMIDGLDMRMDFLASTIKDYNVDAVIAEKLKFCDLWGGELFLLRKESKRLGFPLLTLERELYGGGTGQLQTRVQAFFEQVGNRREIDQDLLRLSGSEYKGIDEESKMYTGK